MDLRSMTFHAVTLSITSLAGGLLNPWKLGFQVGRSAAECERQHGSETWRTLPRRSEVIMLIGNKCDLDRREALLRGVYSLREDVF